MYTSSKRCDWNVNLIIITLGASILSLSLLTLLKYLAIIKAIYPSQRQVTMSIISVWLFFGILILAFQPLDVDQQDALQTTHLYCFIALYSSEPYVMAGSLIVLIYILLNMGFQVWAYSVIVITYSRLQKRKRKSGNYTANEVRLMKKAIGICATFIICWSFFVFKIIYELGSGKESPFILDSIVEFLAALQAIINALILYRYDAKVRRNIQELFPILLLKSGIQDSSKKRERKHVLNEIAMQKVKAGACVDMEGKELQIAQNQVVLDVAETQKIEVVELPFDEQTRKVQPFQLAAVSSSKPKKTTDEKGQNDDFVSVPTRKM